MFSTLKNIKSGVPVATAWAAMGRLQPLNSCHPKTILWRELVHRLVEMKPPYKPAYVDSVLTSMIIFNPKEWLYLE